MISWTLFQQERRLFLRLEMDGREGWGEISPLPGWSSESLQEAKEQVCRNEFLHSPSVTFGFTAALFAIKNLFPANQSFPVSILLRGSAKGISKQAEAAKGFRSAKVKLGDLPLDDAICLTRDLMQEFFLRIDLNRKWPLKKTTAFIQHFSPLEIDYIEEPACKGEDLSSFHFPFALDETCRENHTYFHHPFLKALIWKPTLQHYRPSSPLILSSAEESALGITHLATLMRAHDMPEFPIGIGPLPQHEEFHVEKGYMTLPASLRPNLAQIQEIAHGPLSHSTACHALSKAHLHPPARSKDQLSRARSAHR